MAENDTITARLPDGRTAKFPKGTTPEEMTEAVNAMAAGDGVAAAAPVSDDPIGDQIKQHLRQVPASQPSAVNRLATSAVGAVAPSLNIKDYAFPFTHPITAAENFPGVFKSMLERQGAEATKTSEAFKSGDVGGTISHALGYIIPFVGPQLADAGEQIRSGDIAGGIGTTVGVGAGMFGGELANAGLEAAGRFKEAARSQLARSTGGSPVRTTRPIINAYNEKIAAHGAKETAFKEQAGQAIQHDLEQEKVAGRRSGLEISLQKGSKELGKRIQSLDENLRQEGNEKYQTVRTATANDPGVPIDSLLTSLKAIEDSVPKGSEESIRQIRDLFKKYTDNPDRPNIGFNDLQGYSSEIGAKLSTGNLPGDLYQALKGVKEQLDASKRMIAERNGAGDVLNDADNFWHQYQSTFYDRPSAVAAVRGKVGEIDPEFYAAPFIKGKGGGVGIGNLRTLPTKYASEARATADLAQNLRDAHEELDGMARAKPAKELPVAPTAPTAPTVEDLSKAKAEKIYSTGSRVHPWLLLTTAVAPVTLALEGHLSSGAALFGGAQLLDRVLGNETVVNWLAKPSAGDLKMVKNLPEPTQTQLRTSIETSLKRKPGLKVSPDLMRAVGIAAAASRPVANRQDALDRLKSSAHDAGLGIRP